MIIKLEGYKVKYILITCVCIFLTNICLVDLKSESYDYWLSIFCAFLTITLIKDFFVLHNNNHKTLSISMIFIIFSYLFHFGQVYINVFASNYLWIDSNFLKVRSFDITEDALLFSYTIIELVMIGMLLVNKKSMSRILESSIKFETLKIKQLKIMGWIICILTIPMKLYYTWVAANMVRLRGYGELDIGFSGIYIQFSNFLVLGFVLLLLSYSSQKLYAKLIFISEMLILCILMLGGGRIYSVISIIILSICYNEKIDKINFKNIFPILIVGYFVLQFIAVISVLRIMGNLNPETIFDSMSNPNFNLILRTLDEFGGTIFTVIQTFVEVPDNLPYNGGLSYLEAWILAGINVGGILDDIKESVEYTLLFKLHYSYGGSYIGELYYNFGYFGYVFAPVIGYYIMRLSYFWDELLEKDYIFTFSLLLMPTYAVTTWVRGYFDVFTRSIIWGCLFLLMLRFMLKHIYVKRENNAK